jgi:hypothetical protein
MVYTCLYAVTCYDSPENYTDYGIIYVSNFADAARQIEEYYMSDLVEINHIELFDMPVAHLDKEDFNTLRRKYNEV